MYIKSLITIFLFIFSANFTMSFGQYKGIDAQRAEAYFQKGQYANAAKHFQFACKRKLNPLYLDRLSDCYLKLNEFEKAEAIFKRIEKKYPLTEIQRIKYANLLKHAGKVYLAKTEFLLSINDLDSTSKLKHWALVSACDSMIKWQNLPSKYVVKNFSQVNSEFDEISPVHYLDSLVFASNRNSILIKQKSKFDNRPYFDLYITPLELFNSIPKPILFSKIINTEAHESSATFTENGQKIYFTQCTEGGFENDSVKRMKLYSSEKINNQWIKPHGFVYNDSTFSFAHPSVEKNNKMIFFASDMKGGFGGTDIYVSIQVEDSVWSDPINLGPIINTTGNENYPFYHSDGSLFFASDFHIGMGGYDIFKAFQKNGEWIRIENLKPPINSTYDDIGIFFNNEMNFGYFSSNRPNGKGNQDIYLITKK